MAAPAGWLSCVALGWLILSPPARADHFAIDLEVKAPKASKKATADTAAVGVKPKARGVLQAKAGDKIVIHWTLASTAKKEIAKDVTVHLVVVKEEKAGQVAVPNLNKDVVAETTMRMDFKPKDKAKGDLSVAIDKPGVYLVRVETIGAAAGTEGHEHFAAVDLVIE